MFVQQHWHHRGDDLRRAISNFNPEIYEFQADSKLMIFCWTTKDTKCKSTQTRSYRYVVQLHAFSVSFFPMEPFSQYDFDILCIPFASFPILLFLASWSPWPCSRCVLHKL